MEWKMPRHKNLEWFAETFKSISKLCTGRYAQVNAKT
jgi:hypothetical protein